MLHLVYSWGFILGIGELLGIFGNCELRGRVDGWWRRIFFLGLNILLLPMLLTLSSSGC